MSDLVHIDCKCGAKLGVYCESLTSTVPEFKSENSVRCPDCSREHRLATKPLRMIVKQGNTWTAVGL
jgi:hypothetical protein